MLIPELMKQLKELIPKAYEDDELGMLLDDNNYDYDYAGLPDSMPFKQKIYKLVNASYRMAEVAGVLRLAKIVAGGRPDGPAEAGR